MAQISAIAVVVDDKPVAMRLCSWNYGERMVSRVAHTVEWLAGATYRSICLSPEFRERLVMYLSVNFDMMDVMLTDDMLGKDDLDDKTVGDRLLSSRNHNGYGLIWVDTKGNAVKYAFTHWKADNAERALSLKEYLHIEYGGCDPDLNFNCRKLAVNDEAEIDLIRNKHRLRDCGVLMTSDEVLKFYNTALPSSPTP